MAEKLWTPDNQVKNNSPAEPPVVPEKLVLPSDVRGDIAKSAQQEKDEAAKRLEELYKAGPVVVGAEKAPDFSVTETSQIPAEKPVVEPKPESNIILEEKFVRSKKEIEKDLPKIKTMEGQREEINTEKSEKVTAIDKEIAELEKSVDLDNPIISASLREQSMAARR
ncbi:MAG: hypothetical protein NTV36_02860, partial [Candidatus Staskawiczbacteria bacterium]|nr:hypothetical protein [Candidatus Staskawiczbacteria bacterium]